MHSQMQFRRIVMFMSVAVRDSGPQQMFALAGEARQASMRCRPMFPIDISQVPPQVGAGPFSLTSCTGMYVMDWGLAAAIAQLWIFKEGTHDLNILELGAGCGCYTEYYQWLGFRMRAYDGVPNIENLTDGLVATADLSKPQGFPQADWVLSLEVAEHLRPEETETFINNLVRPAKHGIVLSWASPSTSRLRTAAINSTHPNEKTNNEVVSAFRKFGMHLDNTATTRIRDLAGAFCCPYFKKTLMVFVREPNRWKINPMIRYGLIGSKVPKRARGSAAGNVRLARGESGSL